ncbi:hypothetical protein EVJ58_g7576 [Rhodofomes roseus]|uniref:Uncharacterized protein n=1 Tax=Rhodofomes roseus TaxID=34475 RepID=A0A4Y9Y442_9APHY|nr:hypothetical protein EVJ58_g7576 [Rhodofomes roseus]
MTTLRFTQHAQVGMHINSSESLVLFVMSVRRDAAVGLAIEDLSLSLPTDLEYPVDAVRQCLRLTPNVETLILDLPSSSPVSILCGLTLPKIQLLSTNLPHQCLVSFLASHRSLRSLVLRFCGNGSNCPLRHVDLAHVTELQCPSRCLSGIARGRVSRATVNLTRLASNAVLAVRALSTSPLYSLSLDFYATDYDMLLRVAAAAPNLRKLKLVEKFRPQRRGHQSRRPWNDMISWHQALLRLSFLEEFALRSLVRVFTSRRPDVQVISGWANGTTRRSAPHPTLYHVAILQPCTRGDTRQLTEWFKGSSKGAWERVVNAVGPDVQL